jgi:hypothetical protein
MEAPPLVGVNSIIALANRGERTYRLADQKLR